ncbi:peptidoglycan D,D-transpeptidase FtsI family protein [Parafrankia discariae]|uniref:peptidoglycan D,D-transpeptidase FtsI family protein n=1 Tax=Parafrankia discariae TaxID=365528 RepID=UPI00036F8C74|nr:penicillin-binding protein 2 [Parafrankia discariae]
MSPTTRGSSSGRGRSRLRLVTNPNPGSPDARSARQEGDDLLDPSVRRFSGRDPDGGRGRVTPSPRGGDRYGGARPGSDRDGAGRRGYEADRSRDDRRQDTRRADHAGHDRRGDHGHYDDLDDQAWDDAATAAAERTARRPRPATAGRERRSATARAAASRSATSRSGRSSPRVSPLRSAATGSATPREQLRREQLRRDQTGRDPAGRERAPREAATRGATTRRNPTRGAATRTASGQVRPVRRPRSTGGGAGRNRATPIRRGLGGAPPRPPRPFVLASPRRRVRVSVVLMIAVLVVIAGRLAQLQGFASSNYAEQAEQERLRKSVLHADRGMITDRHGYPLAQDVERRAVYADPFLIRGAEVVDAARKLAPLLGKSENALRKDMTSNNPKVRFVYLGRRLDQAVGDEVEKLGLRGIGVLPERGRWYPAQTLGANFVGFTKLGENDTIVGAGGLELAYDSVLRGTDGRRQIEADPSGREIPSAQSVEKDPVSGSTVRLTIDKDIQWNAQGEIAEAVRSSEADGGTIVVMNPKTGDLLAMADAPQFDPNNITDRDLDAIGNRSTGQAFEPGSVNKVITMAAALDRNLIETTTPITVPPSLERGGVTINDSEPHGTEHLTAAGVLARSSNIGTVLVAEKVGNDNLEQMMRAFGLGRTTEVDFPGEAAGILPPAADWSGSQAATIAYGQGTSATALQMASVYATVANGGMRVAPRLVDAVTGPDGVTRPTAPAPERRVVSPETAATLTRMLEAVASTEGTAPAAEVAGYRVAGKTGTAKRYDPVNGGYDGYVSTFIGFAPADDPQVVVEVVLDHPRKSFYGGEVAAPVFQRVMSFALTTLGVPPPGTRPEPLVLDLDR